MSQTPFEMLEGFVMDLMLQMKIPGMSVGILMNGKSVYAEGFGARNLENNIPMTPDTLFGIGSISKSFASLAIMQLYEQGKLNLQDPVNKYMNFKLGSKENPIRIHHILTHSTGLPEIWATHSITFRMTGGFDALNPLASWKDYLTFINGAESEKFAEPGQKYSYNNDTYALLAQIVEEASNKPYSDYIMENILQPLQMNRSTYSKEKFENDFNAITGYLALDGEIVSNALPFNQFSLASGGLTSSVKEMQNYMIALMSDGIFNGKTIIHKTSLEKMWTPHVKVSEGMEASEKAGYGYGWRIDNDFFGHTLISHGGDFHVCGGEVAMIPQKKMGVVIGLNKQPGPVAEMIARGILAVFLGKNINDAVPLLSRIEKLQFLVGKYQSYKGMLKAEIMMEGGMLAMKAHLPRMLGGTVTLPLIPKNINKLQFTVPMLGMEMPVHVIEFDQKTKNISLMVDRYLLHKI